MIWNAFTQQDVGLPRCQVLYPWDLWEQADKQDQPDKLAGLDLHGDLICLDIEHWTEPDKFVEVVKTFKALYPHKRVGLYGIAPARRYGESLKERFPRKHADIKAWEALNDSFAPVVDVVDVLYPSLYTFYNDPDNWIRYATENLLEARRISKGKPIHPFIWPKYHNSNAELKDTLIDGEFWAQQLKTVISLSDGPVIWGYNNVLPGESPFSMSDWWGITREHL